MSVFYAITLYDLDVTIEALHRCNASKHVKVPSAFNVVKPFDDARLVSNAVEWFMRLMQLTH